MIQSDNATAGCIVAVVDCAYKLPGLCGDPLVEFRVSARSLKHVCKQSGAKILNLRLIKGNVT